MTLDNFNSVINDQIDYCHKVLAEKGKEYSLTDDRLDHFKAAAAAQNVRPKEALWGMAAKHFTSLAIMCKNDKGDIDKALWLEKITDSINYLLLLRAIIEEDSANESN